MEPTANLAVLQEDAQRHPVMTKYLERYGGFLHQRSWGLLHCQLAQVFDLLGSGQVEGAKDVLAMAMVMIDPAVLDAGRLQEDPATQLFTPAQGSSGSVRPCSRGPAKSAPDRSKKQQRAKPKGRLLQTRPVGEEARELPTLKKGD